MRKELFTDDLSQRPKARIVCRSGDGDLLWLTFAPFGDAEKETETGWMSLGDRPDRIEGFRRHIRVALLAEQQCQAQQQLTSDRVSGRCRVVEQILRPGDE